MSKPTFKSISLLGVALSVLFLALPKAALAEDEYTFKVHNTTSDKITRLLASEDGDKYLPFDVGRAGIPAGKTITLKWDKSTNNSGCMWYIKAVFADGSETKAKKFDFCEEDLELEF